MTLGALTVEKEEEKLYEKNTSLKDKIKREREPRRKVKGRFGRL